ncbi:MAG: transglycosylase domain protein [Bacilli bacterium]|nr:transglycosylase domain protein [Bacilli bacterium]
MDFKLLAAMLRSSTATTLFSSLDDTGVSNSTSTNSSFETLLSALLADIQPGTAGGPGVSSTPKQPSATLMPKPLASLSSIPMNPSAYAPIIQNAASNYGVEPALIEAVIQQESGFNPAAVSSAGAQGLMQLMPSTANMLGVTDPFDPSQNINAGVQQLKNLLDRYSGNTTLALAAYNAGSGNVDRYGGVPPFPETQQYVQNIQALASSYKK